MNLHLVFPVETFGTKTHNVSCLVCLSLDPKVQGVIPAPAGLTALG